MLVHPLVIKIATEVAIGVVLPIAYNLGSRIVEDINDRVNVYADKAKARRRETK